MCVTEVKGEEKYLALYAFPHFFLISSMRCIALYAAAAV